MTTETERKALAAKLDAIALEFSQGAFSGFGIAADRIRGDYAPVIRELLDHAVEAAFALRAPEHIGDQRPTLALAQKITELAWTTFGGNHQAAETWQEWSDDLLAILNHAGEGPVPSTLAADKAMEGVTRTDGLDDRCPGCTEASQDAGVQRAPLLKGTTSPSVSLRGEPAPAAQRDCCRQYAAGFAFCNDCPACKQPTALTGGIRS